MTEASLNDWAVEVICEYLDPDKDPPQRKKVSSGSFIRPGLVLTALHSVSGPGKLLVRLHREGKYFDYSAEVLLKGDENGVDLAVLKVFGVEVNLPTIRYGEVDKHIGGTVKGCRAIGFPWFNMDKPELPRSSVQVDGEIPTGSGVGESFLTLRVKDIDLRPRIGEKSEWAGISGSVVFFNDNVVVGVITSHQISTGNFLIVTPITAINSLTKAMEWWEHLSVDPRTFVRLPEKHQDQTQDAFDFPQMGAPTLFHVPADRNPFFIGRDTQLDALHDNFFQKGNPVQAITGLAGMGKSQLAMEYAHRHQKEYDSVIWFQADSSETLGKEMILFAEYLHLQKAQEYDQQRTIQTVKNWLQNQKHWLLVLDNVADLRIVQQCLPPTHQGHILLTTQQQALGRLATRIDLLKLSPEEGAYLLLRRAKRLALDEPFEDATEQEREIALTLCRWFGGLPLAIDQAGAFIEEADCDLSEYLRIFEDSHQELLKRRGNSAVEHQDSVTVTFLLVFRHLEQIHPLAAKMLTFCAFTDAESIPEEAFAWGISLISGREEDFQIVHIAESDQPVRQRQLAVPFRGGSPAKPLQLNEILATLRNYSLIQRSRDDYVFPRALTIHRMVQAVLLAEMDTVEHVQWLIFVTAAFSQVFPEDCENPETWPQCFRCIRHLGLLAEAFQPILADFPPQGMPIWLYAGFLFHRAGNFFFTHGIFDAAIRFLQLAHTIFEKSGADDQKWTVGNLINLGHSYRRQGLLEQAQSVINQAIKNIEESSESNTPLLAASFLTLADIAAEQGQEQEAERLYRQTLTLCEQDGEPSATLMGVLMHLATLALHQQKIAGAQYFALRAFDVWKKRDNVLPHELAAMYEIFGDVRRTQLQYRKAEWWYHRALDIYYENFGPRHYLTLDVFQECGQMVLALQGYQTAEKIFQQVIQDRQIVHGERNEKTVQSILSLHSVYMHQKRYDEAEQLLEPLVASDEPETIPFFDEILELLTSTYSTQGKTSKEENGLEQLLKYRKRLYGAEDKNTQHIQDNLMMLRFKQGKYDHQEPMLLQTVEAVKREAAFQKQRKERKLEQNQIDQEIEYIRDSLLIDIYNMLVTWYLDHNQAESARKYAQKSVTLSQQCFGKDAFKTAQALVYLAAAHINANNVPLYIQTMQQVIPLYERHQGIDHPETVSFRSQLEKTVQYQRGSFTSNSDKTKQVRNQMAKQSRRRNRK